jgi:zeta-carotene desaturase
MQPDVLIIGGGVSGLAAAVDLTLHHYSVLLLEQKPYCGGRTHSFLDPVTGDEIDNGQHLMMGCYIDTLRYLEIIGATPLIDVQQTLEIHFRSSSENTARLHLPRLPQPWAALFGLFGLNHISWSDRLSVLTIGKELLKSEPDLQASTSGLTVKQWLNKHGQSELIQHHLWDIITVSTLNESTSVASAFLFARILKAIFFGPLSHASMVFPRKGLTTVLVDPAIRFIEQHGGVVRTSTTVSGFRCGYQEIASVTLNDGLMIKPKAIVFAIPFFDIPRSWRDLKDELSSQYSSAEQLTSSPILSIHLWYDREFVHDDVVALVDSPIHWIFNKSRIFGRADCRSSYLSLVVSAADSLMDLSKEELVNLADREMRRFYPDAAPVGLIHTRVIKEKRATLSPTVASDINRPSHTTSLKNVFLAGDWTNTGLPATIEGAIRSGFSCSSLVRSTFNQSR